MNELELLVQAILSLKDTTKSKQQILSELPKLEQQLQSDKKARVNIIAGLDINKSKSLIQSQLNTLASQAKAPTIKVGVGVAQNNIVNGLKEIQTQANQTNNVINKVFSGNYASDNTEFLNQFDVAKSKFSSFKEFYKSVGMYNSDLEKMATTWKKQGVYTAELKSKIDSLKNSLKEITIGDTDGMSKWVKHYKDVMSEIDVNPEKQKELNKSLEEQLRIKKDILSYQTQIANLENNPNKTSKVAELRNVVAKRQEELGVLQQETFEATKLMTVKEQEEFLIKNTVKEQERLTVAEKNALDIEQRSKALTDKKADTLEAQIKSYEAINSKAAKKYKIEFDSLKNDLSSAKTSEEVEKVRVKFATLKSEIKVAGKEGQTFFQKMIDGAKKFSSWMSLTTIISTVVRDIRKMVTTVVELDTALIDLKKTFKGTESDLKEFYYTANDVAKQLGVTTKEVITQAAAWSRLGFSTKQQAIEMSKLSSMFTSISPGMDVDTATDGLLSIIKAFGYETNEVLDGIMSKVNIVGNEFGTSNSEIVEMLRRSSSAMKEANNNLSETIALETSAVEITRDAAGVGTAFKTISMRLRGYDEDVEAYTNDVEVLSGEIANLTKTAKTPGGISLFTDESKTEYKSTIQLLREISEIYDELSDKNQAELLETVAGKRQGQIVAAVLENWDTVENALESMENADGSAMREMEVIMESLSYKINEFKENFTGIAQDTVTQDFLKSMIDSGIRLLETFSDAIPILQNFLNIISGRVTGVTVFVKQIGLIPTIFAGLSLKNVGELNQNTPSYAPLPYCA